jgi:hypothetical protein
MSTLSGLFTKKLPTGIWQFTFDEVGKGMKYVVNGRRYEFLAINGVMGITIDATNEKQLWYVISDDCTVQIEEVGQSANPFFSIPFYRGTFTPLIEGSTTDPVFTYSTQDGHYQIINDRVFLDFILRIDVVTSDGVGYVKIPIPFTCHSDQPKAYGQVAWSNVDLPSSAYNASCDISAGFDYMYMRLSLDDAGWLPLSLGADVFTSGDFLGMSINFRKA